MKGFIDSLTPRRLIQVYIVVQGGAFAIIFLWFNRAVVWNVVIALIPLVTLLVAYLAYRDSHREAKQFRQERIEAISQDIVVYTGLAYRDKGTGTLHPVPGINAEARMQGAIAQICKRLEQEV